MDALLQDVRYALRWLRRSPGFTAVVILTLALGIGANAAMFSVVNAVLLRPLPYPDSDRLASVWPAKPLPRGAFAELRERSRAYEGLAGYGDATGFSITDPEADPDRVQGAHVTANLFSVLRVGAMRGRALVPRDDDPGANRVVVLSHGLWQQRFGSDPGAVGRDLVVDGVPHRIVGVMPPEFHFPSRDVRLWVPVSFDRSDLGEFWGGMPVLHAVGRLRPGVALEQAAAETRTLAPRVREAFPWPLPEEWSMDADAAPLREAIVGEAGTPLLVLLGAVGLVLLIACANVANVLLARGMARRKEVATRAALGASRGRLVRQMLTESVLLALLGGGCGLVLAAVGVRALVATLPPETPRVAEIGIDARILGFTLLLAVLTGVAFGLVPALRASRPDLQGWLKEGVKGSVGVGHRRLIGALVTVEIALAVTLVIGAGLLVRSLSHLLRVDTGFRTERVVTARVSPPDAAYREEARVRFLYSQVLDGVRSLPGVEAAAAVSRLPLAGEVVYLPLQVEGEPVVPGAAAPTAGEWRVTPDYLPAMGIPLLRGRAFTDADREDTPPVALVNELMARRFWPGEDPVGQRVRPVWWQDWITVVGVVGNVRDGDLAGEQQFELYRPFLQSPSSEMTLVIRTRSDPQTLAGSLREVVWRIDPTVPVSDVRMMERVVASSVATPRFTMLLLSLFAALALTLGAVGVYGVIAYAVGQRTHEFGIRMALGAGPERIRGLVLRQGVALAAVGVVVGLFAAFTATRLLAGMLYGVSPADPLTFVLVALGIVAVTLLASYVPARRATRVDPIVALRAE